MTFASTLMPSVMVTTFIFSVVRDRSSPSMLSRSGARCCTTTNAVWSTSSCLSSAPTASRPPAEAPMPTIVRRSAVGETAARPFLALRGKASPAF